MSYEAWGDNDDGYADIEQLLKDGWRSGDDLSQAMHDVIDERLRHQNEEGWTPEHDDEHDKGELSRAAACYAAHASAYHRVKDHVWPETYQNLPAREANRSIGWPWASEWWKPSNPRRDLVKAAALIVAEIERIDRAEARNG